jgi:uncharacterized protein
MRCLRALNRTLLERQILVAASSYTCARGADLPIRRLALVPGESAEISVAYFDGTEPQRYTCLEKGSGGGLYRFLSLDGEFTADLPVDADGLVLDYPRLFKWVLS